ncbi:decaprenyl-phosphate phosphoribosyltransferase [Selenomonas ruminantium]|uniref:4-hydroxybenzoate polyprenyltransferase n=1 Tax=Selenomonas ruminantium TaxID=971 RepID=A0A1K1P2C7_SELRU|nr:decaprenyl-phosphate phosphoribosyltransferase [Selenomonas ruminantium]SFW41673.1 4-hydroxybenzoate polyprenyltransferase [Selenomonas ruminantium]
MGKFIWQEMRPHQWTKNLLVFAALLFGGSLFAEEKLLMAVVAFCAFCLASSAVYFFNDIVDAENDRQNPKKCHRPIAAGDISITQAYLWSGLLCLSSLCLAYWVNVSCVFLLAVYIVMNICYTLRLKHMVIVDVMIIAAGFVLRAVLGAAAVGMMMTVWFLLCVMFLSLFLALGKRRHELAAVEENTIAEGRKVLQYYSIELIDQLMTIVTAALLICYALFAVDANTKNHESMVYTVPLALYGMFYYLYVVRIKRGGGAPDEALYKEKPILVVVLVYFASIIVIRNL